MAAAQHALTQRSRGQRSRLHKKTVTVARRASEVCCCIRVLLLPVWHAHIVWLLRFLVSYCNQREPVFNAVVVDIRFHLFSFEVARSTNKALHEVSRNLLCYWRYVVKEGHLLPARRHLTIKLIRTEAMATCMQPTSSACYGFNQGTVMPKGEATEQLPSHLEESDQNYSNS